VEVAAHPEPPLPALAGAQCLHRLAHLLALGGAALGTLLLGRGRRLVLVSDIGDLLVWGPPGRRAIPLPAHGEAVPGSGGLARRGGSGALALGVDQPVGAAVVVDPLLGELGLAAVAADRLGERLCVEQIVEEVGAVLAALDADHMDRAPDLLAHRTE
jgi:hypothetical protein